MKNFREWLGMIVIVISIIFLAIVGKSIISKEGATISDYQFVYSSLLPLVGTWVGVVLAFYFGKENYEAASKRYEKIIDKLSPEILDDVKVNQIMISKKTMVSKKWSEIKNKTVNEIISFLIEVNKSRLPVLDEHDKVKYIIHSSLLTLHSKDENNQISPADTSVKMSSFVEKHSKVIADILIVKENEILESVRKKMSDKLNCKDVFIEDSSGNIVGWLTDTLILRYINSKKV